MLINGSIIITVMWEGHTPPDMDQSFPRFHQTFSHLSFVQYILSQLS